MTETYKFSYKLNRQNQHSLSVYNVGYQKCEKKYQWGPGIRDHYCFHYIISGKGCFISNDKKYQLKQGDSFLLYPNTKVQYFADNEEPWEYAWVGFMGQDAPSILWHTNFRKENPIIKDINSKELIYKQLMDIYNLKGNQYKNEIAMIGGLYTLLSYLVQFSSNYSNSKENIQSKYVKKAMDLITTQYSYHITIDDIADYIGISRSHLYRSFIHYLQQSPKEYLMHYRMKQACKFLQETDLPIRSIALSVGFYDNLYFSKAFKKFTGLNPTAYRKKNNI